MIRFLSLHLTDHKRTHSQRGQTAQNQAGVFDGRSDDRVAISSTGDFTTLLLQLITFGIHNRLLLSELRSQVRLCRKQFTTGLCVKIDQLFGSLGQLVAFIDHGLGLIRDAMEVWRTRDQYGETELEQKRAEFRSRVSAIIAGTWTDSHSLRLVKRLRNYENYLFTFLEREGIPFDNNHGERLIRPAVILRKNSYGNRSEQGADCQAVLMSIFRTLRQRGHDPMRTLIQSVTELLRTGQLPPLPA